MIVVGVVVAALVAFLASSGYYLAVTPVERRVLGAAALDRGRPGPAKAIAELLRTALVATVFGFLAARAGPQPLPGSLALAVILWAGFPLVLLSGSVLWERVPPVTAAMHAGDWLVKLLLIAAITGLLH